MNFDDYLAESDAADQAKKQGLVAAGFGLWRDKTGKIVAKTVDNTLQPVKGSRADIRHYTDTVPKNREVAHDTIDELTDMLDKHATPGTQTDTDVTKYATHKTTAIHPEKAKHLHDDLMAAGFKYEKDEDFNNHVYRKGKVSLSISSKPEIAHKGGGKRDHHSVVFSAEHGKPTNKR